MRQLVAIFLALAACKSSGPYTVPSAIVNSTLAIGAAAHQRASGGCYAACPPGTSCNTATGYCERNPEVCVGSASDDPRCAQAGASTLSARGLQVPGAAGPSVGVSPQTGTVPELPPARPTPERP